MLENIKKWLCYVDNDMHLAGELLESKLTYAKQKKSYEEFLKEKFIPEAKSHGFDFSLEEFNNFVKQSGSKELTMEELEDVSGGKLSPFANIGLGIFSLSLLSAVPTMITHDEGGSSVCEVANNASSSQIVGEEDLDDVQVVQPIPEKNRASNDMSVEEAVSNDGAIGGTANVDISFLKKRSELEKLRHQIFDDALIVQPTPDDEVEVYDDDNNGMSDEENSLGEVSVVSSTPIEDGDFSDYETDDMSDGEDKILKQDKLSKNQHEMAKMFCFSLRSSFECADAEKFEEVIDKVEECIEKEPALVVAPEGKALLVGDLHGNMLSTVKFVLAARLALEQDEVSSVVFLGDYVDRGENSIEVLFSLFKFKLDFPDRVFLIRGNHETESVRPQDLPDALVTEYGAEYGSFFISRLYNGLFQKLPLAVEVPLETGEKFLCVHGGIPIVEKDVFLGEKDVFFEKVKAAMRDMKSNNECLLWKNYEEVLFQILWNDPLTLDNMGTSSTRRRFSEEQLVKFLEEFGYKSLIRGHEATDYIRSDYYGRCYTVFSSSDYCEMKNKACMAIATDGELYEYMNVFADESSQLIYNNSYRDINHALFGFFSSFACDDVYMNLALGYCYVNGKGTSIDMDKGLTIYRELAKRGCADAQFELAYILKNIVKIEYKPKLKNSKLTEEERAVLNEKIEKMTEEYLSFYRQAAEQGHDDARYELGCYYFYRNKYGEAASWFQMIADVDKDAAGYLAMCKTLLLVK